MKKALILCVLLTVITPFFGETVKLHMMQTNGALYSKNDSGNLVAAIAIHAGSEYEILTRKNDDGKTVLDEIVTKRIVDKDLIDCRAYHVSYNNKDYYLLSDRVSLEKNYGIITKDTAIYRSPDYADVNDAILATGTFITYSSDEIVLPINTTIIDTTKGFRKITYFDMNSYTKKIGYIKQSNVASSKDDLKALQLLAKLKTLSDVEMKRELLKTASSFNVSTGISSLLKSAENSLQ